MKITGVILQRSQERPFQGGFSNRGITNTRERGKNVTTRQWEALSDENKGKEGLVEGAYGRPWRRGKSLALYLRDSRKTRKERGRLRG